MHTRPLSGAPPVGPPSLQSRTMRFCAGLVPKSWMQRVPSNFNCRNAAAGALHARLRPRRTSKPKPLASGMQSLAYNYISASPWGRASGVSQNLNASSTFSWVRNSTAHSVALLPRRMLASCICHPNKLCEDVLEGTCLPCNIPHTFILG